MHRKTDSEESSLNTSTSPRSPPRRPVLYYVQSPSLHDEETYASSPLGSPLAQQYHSTESSSTTRFSGSLMQHQTHPNGDGGSGGLKRTDGGGGKGGLLIMRDSVLEEGEEEGDEEKGSGSAVRFYVTYFVFSFVFLFTIFSLILWGVSKSYKPRILVEGMQFQNFYVQFGSDDSGIQTDMMSLNSTVRILYRNRGTFFGVHVSATPFDLYSHQLKLASGQMKEFYQPRKSGRNVSTVVLGNQVPLYGGIAALGSARDKSNHVIKKKVRMDLNLTFRVRSRAYVLGRLVKTKFYRNVRCPVTLDDSRLGKHVNLKDLCVYD